MFWRAVIAFLVLPGVVAFAVPAIWLWWRGQMTPVHPEGLVLLALGFAGLIWCVRDFYVRGRGTLAPWAPPKELVVVGLYRFSRNPMYVCVLGMLAGWAGTFQSFALFAYMAVVAIAFHGRVVLGEEPWLARTHGSAWQAYIRRVPRWVGQRNNPTLVFPPRLPLD